MSGRGSLRVLAVGSPDLVLSVVGPLGLAAARGEAVLVVDMESRLGARSGRTLADIVADGPTRFEISPGRTGVAMIPAGALSAAEVHEVVGELASRWPAVVIRPGTLGWPGPVVPLIPLLPGWLAPSGGMAAVWQRVPGGAPPPGPGPVLPRLRTGLVRQMLSGRLPGRSPWVKAWSPVWALPWA